MSEECWPPAESGEDLGGCSGDVDQAVEFGREVAMDWRQRVVMRLDGGRTINGDGTPNPNGKLLWTVYAR